MSSSDIQCHDVILLRWMLLRSRALHTHMHAWIDGRRIYSMCIFSGCFSLNELLFDLPRCYFYALWLCLLSECKLRNVTVSLSSSQACINVDQHLIGFTLRHLKNIILKSSLSKMTSVIIYSPLRGSKPVWFGFFHRKEKQLSESVSWTQEPDQFCLLTNNSELSSELKLKRINHPQ